MNKALMLGLIALLGVALATNSAGAVLGHWALTADGTGTTEEAGKVTVGNFIGGPGIGEITYGSNGGYANGWTLNATPDSTDYFEVTLSPQAGYGLIISQIDFGERRSGTGIREFQVRVSTNNFSSYTLLATTPVPDTDGSRAHSIPDLNLQVQESHTVGLRFYGYQAESALGNWRINANTLKILGTAMSLTGPPTVGFVPSSGVQVHVSNTLEVAVSILPTGTIHDWSVEPPPAGSTSLTGGTFYFTPTAADDGKIYTLGVVGSNSYGVSTGTLAITVTEYLLPGTLEITFENAGEIKSSYDLGTVVLSGEPWIFEQARIGDTENDVKIGRRAACFGSYYPAYIVSSNKLLPAGLGTISFLYAQYGGDNDAEALLVEVATDAEAGPWLQVGRVDANGVTTLTPFEATVNVIEPMYVRIRTDYVPNLGRVNVDNIIITPYQAPVYSAYDAYLLEYNVTPGDPGTAPGEDWDGDGFTNQQEFEASPQTNPYDADSHP